MNLFEDMMSPDDPQWDSFANGDDLAAANAAIVNNPDFQAAHPTYETDEAGGVTVTDIFGGTHHYSSMEEANLLTDFMSGLPTSEFGGTPPAHHGDADDTDHHDPSFSGSEVKSVEQMKLDKSEEIESIRDAAVQHYKDAKARGDIEEMLKWEAEANKQQGRLYDHWGTPTYGLPPKAPGIS